MKVAIDARNLIVRQSGIGRYVVESARHLADLGCQVTLHLPQPPDPSFSGLDRFAMRVADARNSASRVLWGQTTLPKQVAADGADLFWGPAHRLPSRLPGSIPKVLTVLDLVWVHASETMRWRTWIGERLLMTPAVRAADVIVAISDATATDVRERFKLAPETVITVHPGATPLSLNADDAILRLNGLHEGSYALFVGTLEPRKNLKRLLEAYAALSPDTRSKCSLVLAGGKGWHLDDLSRMVAQHALDRDVVLLDYVSEPELGRLYAGAHFVAMPSLYEGFGLPLIEANAFGVPTLTSDRSSMPEVAGAAGRLVDPYNTTSITSGLQDLIENEALHSALASAAKANAGRFDWGRSAGKLLSAFQAAVERRSPSTLVDIRR